MFVIVLAWTPPHFWALALLLAPGYAAAKVPMMPVVRGPAATTRRILVYTAALTAVSLLPVLTGAFGVPYAPVAGLLDAGFAVLAVMLWRAPTARRSALLFHYSLLYLALLFCAAATSAAL